MTLPWQPVTLPDPEGFLTDKLVKEYVGQVLKGLGNGLALWQAGQCLWAQRLGHSHAFWALGRSCFQTVGEGLMERSTRTRTEPCSTSGPSWQI